jgi:hypothetical protein
MPNSNDLNGSDHMPDKNGNGVFVLDNLDQNYSGGILQSYFALLFIRHRRLLITAGLVSMALVFVLTRFVMHPKYEATAIIRPVGQNPNSIGSLLQTAGVMSQSLSGVGIDSDIGTNVHDPDELVAVLNSYTFMSSMIQAENLGPKLTGGFSIGSLIPSLPFIHHEKNGSPLWGYYRALSGAFDCENSLRTGNITLTFIHKDPEFARRVVALFIDRLRDQLRAHDVSTNKAAAVSLEEAAASATDPMLRDDLYQLAAMQVQKIKTAQANADFAFNVLEDPYVPPEPVKPWVMLDTLAAGIAVPLLIFAILVLRDWGPLFKQELAEAESESRRIPSSIAVARKPRRIPTPEDDRPYPPAGPGA